MDKKRELEKVSKEIKKCKVCKVGKIGKPVPGEGNPDAYVMFVGEAPGKTEAETGRPFVGRSGKLLRSLIREIGLSEDEVFITSPVKYLPAGRQGLPKTPSLSDIGHGRVHLLKQIEVIDPKIIVLLGSVAAYGFLNDPTSSRLRGTRKILITKQHGEVIEKNGRKLFITFHPSYILRFQRELPTFRKDFKRLKKLTDETNR